LSTANSQSDGRLATRISGWLSTPLINIEYPMLLGGSELEGLWYFIMNVLVVSKFIGYGQRSLW